MTNEKAGDSAKVALVDKILDLFKTSAVTQGLISTICLLGTFMLLASGRGVPDNVWVINGIVVGFFFGGKVGIAQGVAKAESERNAK